MTFSGHIWTITSKNRYSIIHVLLDAFRKYLSKFQYSIYSSASITNRNSQGLLNDAQQPELYSSKCLKMMQAFRQIFSNVDSSNYFSNVCMKNVEFHFNQIENMQMSNLFDIKYKEHHLVALAMSLYCDVSILPLNLQI